VLRRVLEDCQQNLRLCVGDCKEQWRRIEGIAEIDVAAVVEQELED
jgi:hypothetical protein